MVGPALWNTDWIKSNS